MGKEIESHPAMSPSLLACDRGAHPDQEDEMGVPGWEWNVGEHRIFELLGPENGANVAEAGARAAT